MSQISYSRLLWWADLGLPPGAHQAALSLPFLNRTGGENVTKSSWVEISTERHHAPITVTSKTDLTWGN